MKMKRKLAKTDSTKAEEVFGDVKGRYVESQDKNAGGTGIIESAG